MEYASVDWYKSSASKQYLKREKMINDHAKIQTDHLNKIKRNKLLQSINPVRELKSDYFDMSSYYYSAKQNKIYEIENVSVILREPDEQVDTHLRELNFLPSRTVVNYMAY